MKKLLAIILLLPLFSNAQNHSVSIGPSNDSTYLLVANTTIAGSNPQPGTVLQLVSSGVTNGRISFDTYNGASNNGSTIQGRRSGGSISSGSAALQDYTLLNIAADGYPFHNISVGAMAIKADGTFSSSSAPTYINFFTTPSGSISASERMRIKSDGTVNISGLNAIGVVQTNSSGDVATALLTKSQITTALGYTPFAPTDTVPVKVTNSVEIANDSGSPIPVNGTVSIGNFPSSQAVTGTFFQTTQPVSGTFFQATQPVSGTFWQATQPVSGTISVGNFPATQPVSGTFWQSTQPISVASLPLPTGAATSANQSTANTSLNNLDGDLGASTDATVTAAGNGSIIALLKGIQAYLASTLTTQNINVVPTYSASFTNVSPALLATDIFQIAGAAGKTIYISKIVITGTQTTAGVINIQLIKRSTLNSGGTSATLTNVPHDGNDGAASAVVRTYTANPTVGTAIGPLRAEKFYLGTATLQPQSITWVFGSGEKYPILRSATDALCIDLVGMTVAGGSISGYIEWMEL